MGQMDQETLADRLQWQQKVRNVDASLHAAFAAQTREAEKKKKTARFRVRTDKVLESLPKPGSDQPITSNGYSS